MIPSLDASCPCFKGNKESDSSNQCNGFCAEGTRRSSPLPPTTTPQTNALAELAIGDCFEFTGRRTKLLPQEYVPRWRLLAIKATWCEAALKSAPGTTEASPIPKLSVRLAPSTLVRKVESGDQSS